MTDAYIGKPKAAIDRKALLDMLAKSPQTFPDFQLTFELFEKIVSSTSTNDVDIVRAVTFLLKRFHIDVAWNYRVDQRPLIIELEVEGLHFCWIFSLPRLC